MEAASPPKHWYPSTKVRGVTYNIGICTLTNITTFCDKTTCKLVRFHQRLVEPTASSLYPEDGGSKCL
jgi:hypothetical protein